MNNATPIINLKNNISPLNKEVSKFISISNNK